MKALLLLLVFSVLSAPFAFADDLIKLEELYYSAEDLRSLGEHEEARQIYEKGAQLGHAPSMVALGIMIGDGYGSTAGDPAQAMEWFVKARDTGHTDGLRAYAYLQLSGSFGGTDYSGVEGLLNPDTAISTLEEFAAKGDASSMAALGSYFYDPEAWDRRDVRKAVEWYKKAVEAGEDHYTYIAAELQQAIETPLEKKRETYDGELKAAARVRNASQTRGIAFSNFIKSLYDGGMPLDAIEPIAMEEFAALVKSDFHAIRSPLSNRDIPAPIRKTLKDSLSEAQRAELEVIIAHRRNANAPTPRIHVGNGWSDPATGAVAQTSAAQTQPAAVVPPPSPAKPALPEALANIKDWDAFFAIIPQIGTHYLIETHTKAFVAHYPAPAESIRAAYHKAVAAAAFPPHLEENEAAGRLFYSYHTALRASGLSPTRALALSRDEFRGLASKDIYRAYYGIPGESESVGLFRALLNQTQLQQVQQIAQAQMRNQPLPVFAPQRPVASGKSHNAQQQQAWDKLNKDIARSNEVIAALAPDPATRPPVITNSTPPDIVIQRIDAALMQNLRAPKNRKNVHLTPEQVAALEMISTFLPIASRTHLEDYNRRLSERMRQSPAIANLNAGNQAMNDKNMREAVVQWKKASEQGNPFAKLNLARRIYRHGVEGVVEKDSLHARQLILEAAQSNETLALESLSTVYAGLYEGPRDYVKGAAAARESIEKGGSNYAKYLYYWHVRQNLIADGTLVVPNSEEDKARKAEGNDALKALREAASGGDSDALYSLARYYYYGDIPGLRFGKSFSSLDLNLPLARFLFTESIKDNALSENLRQSASDYIAKIDQAMSLVKGREWTAADIQAALEAGINQTALTYLISRESARLTKRDYAKLVATEAWKHVPDYSMLSMELVMHILTGPDQGARTIAEDAIEKRRRELKLHPVAPNDSSELRQRYAAGDPAAAYTLMHVLNAKHPYQWPDTETAYEDVLNTALSQNYPPSQYMRVTMEGLLYNNDKTKLDWVRAVELTRMSAEAGDADAAMALGDLYAAVGSERGVRRNYLEAEYWYIQAGALAWPDRFKGTMGIAPEVKLAQLYSLETPSGSIGGLSLRANDPVTQLWIRELRKRGGLLKELADEKAAYYKTKDAGNFDIEPHIAALPVEQAPFEERELMRLEREAQTGDTAAQLTLARAYAHGKRGLRQRDDIALKLYQLAAQGGSREAMAALSEHYEKGYGVKIDLLLAVQLKSRAEGKSRTPGAAAREAGKIARSHSDTDHLTLDLFRMAAEGGDPEGMYLFASALADTKYGQPKPEESFAWLLKSGEAGYTWAFPLLSRRYKEGAMGAPKDLEKSFYWMERTGQSGNVTHYFLLGAAYEKGENGAPKDLHKALYWYRRDVESGRTTSNYRVKRLEEALGISGEE